MNLTWAAPTMCSIYSQLTTPPRGQSTIFLIYKAHFTSSLAWRAGWALSLSCYTCYFFDYSRSLSSLVCLSTWVREHDPLFLVLGIVFMFIIELSFNIITEILSEEAPAASHLPGSDDWSLHQRPHQWQVRLYKLTFAISNNQIQIRTETHNVVSAAGHSPGGDSLKLLPELPALPCGDLYLRVLQPRVRHRDVRLDDGARGRQVQDHPWRRAALQFWLLGPDDRRVRLRPSSLAPPPAPLLSAPDCPGRRLLVHSGVFQVGF